MTSQHIEDLPEEHDDDAEDFHNDHRCVRCGGEGWGYIDIDGAFREPDSVSMEGLRAVTCAYCKGEGYT